MRQAIQTITTYIKTESGLDVVSEKDSIIDLDDDESFPIDYWVNELRQVTFSEF